LEATGTAGLVVETAKAGLVNRAPATSKGRNIVFIVSLL
jgi:hypothetical protein